MEWEGETLSEYFADDFANFSISDFKGLPNNDRQNLRDFLWKCGVYVRKGRGVPIADALSEVVHDPASWRDQEED